MRNSLIILPLTFSALSQAAPGSLRKARATSIEWTPCDLNGTVSILCGSLAVPLDYTASNSTSTINLELFKVAATRGPSKNRILLNFGGPGDYGGTSLAALGEELLSATGGTHDLIAFAPRGTDKTLTFSCDSTAEVSLLIPGLASDTALGQLWGYSNLYADDCLAAQKKTGSLIGTAFVARDMMRIVDELEEDGLLRYWGFSYGSVLGASVAGMFPERMDKVIIDGIVNIKQYYYDFSLDNFSDADDVFNGFISGCIASPSTCALAANHTFTSLQSTLYTFLTDLKYNPIPVSAPGFGFLLDYTTVQAYLTNALYTPASWPATASLLSEVLAGNYASLLTTLATPSTPAAYDELSSLYGIMCGDKFPRSQNLDGILPALFEAHRSSHLIGDVADRFSTVCAQWGFEAKERYEPRDSVKTRFPMLVIGNTYDPVTALANARNVSAGFEGSVLLEHGGYGHTSIAQASLCTVKAIRAYFANGTLPAEGTVCPVEVKLFSDKGNGWEDVMKQLESE